MFLMENIFNCLTILNFKRFISLGVLSFAVFLSSNNIAEELLTKSEILKKSNECFENLEPKLCNDLFLKMEKTQLFEYEQKRYRCQASIVGLQTELVEAYFFKKLKKSKQRIMIPYVIKNC